MAIYTVHAPASYGIDPRVTADKVVFVRDGFYVWAFAAAIVWLIWHRLWLALVGYIALSVAAELGLRYIGASSGTRLLVMIVLAFLVGLEAGSLRRWKLSRGKWRQLDVVSGKDEEEAERRFFDRTTTIERDGASPGTSTMHPLPRSSLNPQNDVVGLFPQPGAPR
jgi:Protein of unknown function (DUF2628)